MVMDLGFRSDPKLHRAPNGPFRVRIEAWQRGWRQLNLGSDGCRSESNEVPWGGIGKKKTHSNKERS